MDVVRVLHQQEAEVGRRPVRGRDGQQHDGLGYEKALPKGFGRAVAMVGGYCQIRLWRSPAARSVKGIFQGVRQRSAKSAVRHLQGDLYRHNALIPRDRSRVKRTQNRMEVK